MEDKPETPAGCRRVDTASERHKLLAGLCRRFELHGIIYLHVEGSKLPRHELWLAHTFDDPAGQRLCREHLPALQRLLRLGHGCVRPRPLSECRMVGEVVRSLPLGVAQGFVFPLHGPHGSFALALALAADENALKQQMPTLHLFMTRFFERFLQHASEERAERVDAHTRLSRRELECLYWCACGKSYWETAVILGLSERTVNHYMKTVRQKLGVQSNAQAVAIASLSGLFVDYICDLETPRRSA